ncbi:hypothetical protein ACSBL2_06620 [Pedobacter sp. AW31-3R]|uniref:hypothetical protein n=1 Tax=Pedobacter sp. AW31-3R TaxID=3445781 RepID=UPI003F9F1CB5
MKILFFTSPIEDYLADAVLHGLRMLYGKDVVDYPKCEILYKNCPQQTLRQVRGCGFTLYSGLLDDMDIDRFKLEEKIRDNYFDLIIFGDIQREFGLFIQFRPWLNFNRTLILDGFDTTQPYPARGFWWRRPYFWFLPAAHRNFLYFKREWTPDTHFTLWRRMLPASWRALLPQHKNVRSISYSIPREKIVTHLPKKIKEFPKHIVDPEVASKVPGSLIDYAFQSEAAYYKDLQESRFGITTMRAGWDCLRHYEIAANGTVLCFKDLDKKPESCAPHGLTDGVNCISYHNFDDLKRKIEVLTEDQYKLLQRNTLQWIRTSTTTRRVRQLLREFQQSTRAEFHDSKT